MKGSVCEVEISRTGKPNWALYGNGSNISVLLTTCLGGLLISGNYGNPIGMDSGDGNLHINDIRFPDVVIRAKTGHKDVNVVRMRYVAARSPETDTPNSHLSYSPCERYVASGNTLNEVAIVDIRNPSKPLFRFSHDSMFIDLSSSAMAKLTNL